MDKAGWYERSFTMKMQVAYLDNGGNKNLPQYSARIVLDFGTHVDILFEAEGDNENELMVRTGKRYDLLCAALVLNAQERRSQD